MKNLQTTTRRMTKRAAIVLSIVLALTMLYTGIAFAAAADLDQCANGGIGSPPTPCAGNGSGSDGWTNGNVNAAKAHWKEGDFLPYRMRLTGITSGTWTLNIGWDATHSNAHAIDYLGTFSTTETLAKGNNPCDTVGCLLTNNDAFPVPADPSGPQNCSALPGKTQVPGSFYIFGASGTVVDITGVSAYLLSGCAPLSPNTENRIAIHFTSTDPNPVIAWAGHVGAALDWGQGLSAGGISGSPYHMRLKGLCAPGGDTTTTCADGGNQDRSLSAAAVGVVTMTTQRDPATVTIPPGGNVRDVATLTGNLGNTQSPSGTVDFYLCRSVNPLVTPTCTTLADSNVSFPGGLGVAVVTSQNTGTATTPFFNTFLVGKYCFLALYHSTNTNFGDTVADITPADPAAEILAECFTISGPTAVTLVDLTARTNGNWLPLGLGVAGILVLGTLAFVLRRRNT